MYRHRVSFHVLGLVTVVVGGAMLIPFLIALGYGEGDAPALGFSSLITMFVGGIVAWFTYQKDIAKEIHHKQGFLIAGMSWVLMGLFGSLPFILFGVFGPFSFESVTNSIFESVSGFTTTGATVLARVENLPHGILFWRSFTQWFGGLGIVVLSLAILPFLGVAGMQLYRAEPSLITSEKLRPRIVDVARMLWRVYLLLTIAEICLLMIGGMPLFDAICHTFTTVSTGGYSIKDSGIMAYNSPFIEWVLVAFMLLAGTNFSLLYLTMLGKPKRLFRNGEWRFYISIFIFASLVLIFCMQQIGIDSPLAIKIRQGAFSVASILTTTGFANADWATWGPMAGWTILLLIIVGGCTGSTAGGIRVLRFLVTLKQHWRDGFKLMHPHSVSTMRVGDRIIPRDVIRSMSGHVMHYLFIAFVGGWLLAGMGLSVSDSFAAILACIGNVGPGLGIVGPTSTYATIPLAGKWVCLGWMIVGRLELFTILILLTPEFWRR
ncbi:TrkH family potassium uptake protein [Bdellovibrionota bacterium]